MPSRWRGVRHPWHLWLRPSGYIGQSAGIVSLAIMAFLWLYPVRKRFRWLGVTGPVSRWLDWHVATALLLPLTAAIHAAWRFDGIIGLGYWAMMVVWLSGVVGRYLYARIPRSRAGVELSIEEIAAERRRLQAQLAEATGLEPAQLEQLLAAPAGNTGGSEAPGIFRRLITDGMARRRAIRQLQQRLRQTAGSRRHDRTALRRVLRLARREVALRQQAQLLDRTRALFRYWHVAHRPVAIGAAVAVLVHVGVVVAVGATWFR